MTAASGVAVRCDNVVQIYTTAGGHDVVALRGVNLAIEPGESVALLGPSGSGKSTLLGLLGGLLRPSAGRVVVDGTDISRLPERELARLRATTIAVLLQGAIRNLLPYVDAAANLEFARRSLPPAARRDLPGPRELLDRLGVPDTPGLPVRALSAGERQRVAFAAAVSSGAGLLLVDEPTSQLGHADRDAVVDLIGTVNRTLGTSVVLVTHDPEVAAAMQRSVTIRNGRVGSEGHRGRTFGVVDDDGTVHLPDDLGDRFAAGTLVEFEPTDDGVLMKPVER